LLWIDYHSLCPVDLLTVKKKLNAVAPILAASNIVGNGRSDFDGHNSLEYLKLLMANIAIMDVIQFY
jgi:hypothetical protein